MRRLLSYSCLLLLLMFGGVLSAQTSFNNSSVANESPTAGGAQGEDGLIIPNAFTPNDDGVNDVFYIPDANLTRVEFAVYDRWGNRVFYSDNPSFRWYGDFAGKQVPQGVYVYTLTATSPRKADIRRTGNITIVR